MISNDLLCITFFLHKIFNTRSSRRHPVEDVEYKIQEIKITISWLKASLMRNRKLHLFIGVRLTVW